MNPYFYIFFTLLFTVYGQLILKWRLSNLKVILPEMVTDKLIYLIKLVLDPFIFSGFIAAFVASLFWMAAMTKFEITHAYPFMSLAPALVFLLGVFVLNETFTLGKVIADGFDSVKKLPPTVVPPRFVLAPAAVVAPVPPTTFVYGPPEVDDTCHWFVIPRNPTVKFVAVIETVPFGQIEAAVVATASGAFGVPAQGYWLSALAIPI
jgi:undecaprenyl phosphate-alpha-L-ara4N flippase subunit ArnF